MVYIDQNEHHPTLLDIVIQNIGKGMARDIRFELSEPIPHCSTERKGQLMNSGPLIDGIAALPPGGKRLFLWGNYKDIEETVGDQRLVVTCRFRRASQICLSVMIFSRANAFQSTARSNIHTPRHLPNECKTAWTTLSRRSKRLAKR